VWHTRQMQSLPRTKRRLDRRGGLSAERWNQVTVCVERERDARVTKRFGNDLRDVLAPFLRPVCASDRGGSNRGTDPRTWAAADRHAPRLLRVRRGRRRSLGEADEAHRGDEIGESS
jgi:hypothetical protein